MTTRGRGARRGLAALIRDFERKNRPEAIRNLLVAVDRAMKQIADDQRRPRRAASLSRPRPAG